MPVGNPSEIDEIFDDISYNKGASVIRMLHHYIGDEDFRFELIQIFSVRDVTERLLKERDASVPHQVPVQEYFY